MVVMKSRDSSVERRVTSNVTCVQNVYIYSVLQRRSISRNMWCFYVRFFKIAHLRVFFSWTRMRRELVFMLCVIVLMLRCMRGMTVFISVQRWSVCTCGVMCVFNFWPLDQMTSGHVWKVVNCYISGWMVNISMITVCLYLGYTECDIAYQPKKFVGKYYLAVKVRQTI